MSEPLANARDIYGAYKNAAATDLDLATNSVCVIVSDMSKDERLTDVERAKAHIAWQILSDISHGVMVRDPNYAARRAAANA